MADIKAFLDSLGFEFSDTVITVLLAICHFADRMNGVTSYTDDILNRLNISTLWVGSYCDRYGDGQIWTRDAYMILEQVHNDQLESLLFEFFQVEPDFYGWMVMRLQRKDLTFILALCKTVEQHLFKDDRLTRWFKEDFMSFCESFTYDENGLPKEFTDHHMHLIARGKWI